MTKSSSCFGETGRSKSGLQIDERHAELYAVRDGKVVYRKGFSDPDEALDAVGLREYWPLSVCGGLLVARGPMVVLALTSSRYG